MRKSGTNAVKTIYLSIMSLAFATASLTSHAESISPEEAHAIGVRLTCTFIRS